MKRSARDAAGELFPRKMQKPTTLKGKIDAYVQRHGFGDPRPDLSEGLTSGVFRDHYYDKSELMEFCRTRGISTVGLKEDLNKRIDLYLRTGKVTTVLPTARSKEADSTHGLSLDKPVINYKSDPKTRTFFAAHIKGFSGFSALVQKQLKQRLAQGDSLVYRDVINMHKQFMQDKQKGHINRVAHESCQYNQFFIDYRSDPDQKFHSNKEAWMLVRDHSGPKTYQHYKDKIKEIILSLDSSDASVHNSVKP